MADATRHDHRLAADGPGTRGDRTRRAIVAAARARFAAQGFEATTLADVAADAGVSGPTVAFHFGSKAGLLVAVINDHFDTLVAEIDDVVGAASSPAERLAAFTRFWLRANEGELGLFSVFAAQGAWRTGDSETGVALRDNMRRVTRVVERLIDDLKADGTLRSGPPTPLVRDTLLGTCEFVLRGPLLARRPRDHDRIAGEILDLVLHGAAARPPATATEPHLADLERKLDLLLARSGPPPREGA